MANDSKNSDIISAVGSVLAGFAGLLGAVAQFWKPDIFPPPFDKLQDWQRWAIIGFLLVLGVLVWIRRSYKSRSRLLQPEAFRLQPNNPSHLKGRAAEIDDLRDACNASPLVWLVGESGCGKTALVLSGLIPALQKTRTFYPIYLDTWVGDWDTGPHNSLAAVLQNTLNADERANLGLDQPVSGELLFPLRSEDQQKRFYTAGGVKESGVLAVFRQKIGRMPLLIFDQFDDYQAIHRDQFLRGKRRAWISAASLLTRNAFWRQIKEQLDHGNIHLVFVTRADAAAGLISVQFCDPESKPLDRLNAEYLLPLLGELTHTSADGSVIVANPERGWQQLNQRLERDLTRDGVVLPIQIQAAIQGLASLNNHILTVRNYERAGGLPGLEATFVERCIASVKRLYHIEPAASRAALLKLVDGAKTVPRTVSELVHGSGLEESSVEPVLNFWETLGLVRQRVALDASGSDPSSKEANWALYHDYLSRGVVAAQARANLWSNLLEENHRTFNDAGTLASRWRALLAPSLQLRLAWERIRGRFRYGAHATFASCSLVRFSPLLIPAAFGLGLLWFTQADQTKNQAERFVKEIGRVDNLQDDPVLWEFAASSIEVRREFWREALQNPDDAERLRNENRCPLLVHATIGLDPDGEQKNALREVIRNTIERHSVPAASVLLLAAALCQESCPRDASIASPLLKEMLAALAETYHHNLQLDLAQALAAVPGKLSDAQAQDAFKELLAALAKTDNAYAELAFAQALAAVSGKLPDAQAQDAFKELLAALTRTGFPGVKLGLAQALAAVPGKLSDAQAQDAFKELLAALANTDNAYGKLVLAQALAAVPAKLSDAQAQDAFKELLAALAKTNDVYTKLSLAQALAAVPGKLSDAQAQDAFKDLLADLAKTDDAHSKFGLAQALAAVPGKLSDAQAQDAFKDLLAALAKTDDAHSKLSLAQALAAVPAKLSDAQAQDAFKDLLADLAKTDDDEAKIALAQALAAVSGELPDAQAQDASKELLAALANTDNAYGKLELAQALAAVPGKLPDAQAQDASKELLAALANTDNDEARRALAQALAVVPGQRTTPERQALIDILKSPDCFGNLQTAVLEKLGEEAGLKFGGDVSAAARWGRSVGLDVTSALSFRRLNDN